ncbi:MAG: transposase [Bacilli bacterium]|nr:transposase [Bacilli bacterium]
MYKTFRFRMYPNQDQIILINKTFGCSRFIYNYFLDKCKKNGYTSCIDMIKELPSLSLEYEWLKEVDSCSLRCSLFNLEDAFKNFFSKRSNYPIFKNKFSRQSYRTNCITGEYKGKKYSNVLVDLINKKIKLPKLGLVDIRGYRNLEVINGKIMNVCVVKETTGKYYCNVLYDMIETKGEKVKPKWMVGIDLGVKDLVVTSNGEKFSNPKEIKRFEKRIKRLQRKLARQIKGSSNYNKTKIKLSKLYSKLKNSRKHNIINIVNKLLEENDIIVSENLNVKRMTHKSNLAKNILDASFSKICNMLEYKSKIKGKYYYKIDPYFPSSKICCHCGEKTEETKNLGVREWECSKCHSINDRDINASINIMFEGLKVHFEK